MRPKIVNRVVETTVSTGAGTIELDGAQKGYRAFLDELNSGDKTIYLIADSVSSPTVYEMGIGTVTIGATTTLSRDEVIDSSNSGNKISLTSGTHIVTGTVSAELLNILADVIDSDHDLAGSSGAYTLTTLSGVTPYEGMMIGATANHDNPVGVATLNRNAAGAVNIVLPDGSAPHAGALKSGRFYLFRFNAANKWVVLNPTQSLRYLHASGNVSAVAHLDITDIPSDAEKVEILIDNLIPSVNNGTLLIATSNDNGTTFDAGADDYSHVRLEAIATSSAPAGSTPNDDEIIFATQVGNQLGNQAQFKIEMFRPGASNSTYVNFEGDYVSGTGNMIKVIGTGRRLAFEAVDALRLKFASSVNITSANYTVLVERPG